MKLFTRRKIIQKMTIVLVILMLFNFITPNFVKADTAIESAGKMIFLPVRGFFVMVGDAFMNGLQYLFVTNEKAVKTSTDQVEEAQDNLGADEPVGNIFFNNTNPLVKNLFGEMVNGGYWEDIPNFKYTPQSIFEGSIKAFNINFIASRPTTNEGTSNSSNESDTVTITDTDYTNEVWYKAYVIAVDKLKQKLKDTIDKMQQESISGVDDGIDDEITKLQILQILKKLTGCSIQEIDTVSDVDNKIKVPSNSSTVRNIVKKLSSRYQSNHKDIYAVFDIDKDGTTEYAKVGCKIIDEVHLLGVIGVYHNDVGDDTTSGETLDYDKIAPVNALHGMIVTWYRIMRNIALVCLLSMLVYVGIRIMISSTSADSAKYKKMLVDWIVALCILFALHYIMAFTGAIIDMVVNAFSTGSNQANWVDDIFGTVRIALQDERLSNQLFYTVLYLVLVIYTVVFTVYYLKRVVYAAFLTLIAPLVSITYPLDKMGDGKSQAFDFWLKEYIANAIIQPVHLLIYTVLISSVFSLATTNPLYALVVMGAMMPTEKFIREMFGLNSKKGPGPAGGLAAGALAMNAFGKLMHGKPPQLPKPDKKEGAGGAEKKPRTQDTRKDTSSSSYSAMIDDGGFDTTPDSQAAGGSQVRQQDDEEDDFDDFDTTDDAQPPYNRNAEASQAGTAGENAGADTGSTRTTDTMETSNDGEGQETGDSYDRGSESYDESTDDGDSGESRAETPSNNAGNRRQQTSTGRNSSTTPKSRRLAAATSEGSDGKTKLKITAGKPKVKPSKEAKRRARYTRNLYKKQQYKDVTKNAWKTVGKGILKGAVKGAGTAVGVLAGATAATAVTIASGDADKLLTNMTTGVIAGARGGQALADATIGTTGAIAGDISNKIAVHKDAKKEYEDKLRSEDPEYKKYKEGEESRKKAHSLATKAAIRAHYGYNAVKDKDIINEKADQIQTFMDYGVENVDTALKAIDLMDTQGLTESQAMMTAYQSERFEKGDIGRRNTVREEMTNAFLKKYIVDGDSSEEALRKAQIQSHKILENVDRVHGVKEKDVGRPEKEYMAVRQAEKDRARREREESAKLNAQAREKAERKRRKAEEARQAKIDEENRKKAEAEAAEKEEKRRKRAEERRQQAEAKKKKDAEEARKKSDEEFKRSTTAAQEGIDKLIREQEHEKRRKEINKSLD